MARKISYKRIGEYLQTALKIALENGGSYPSKQIIEEIKKRISLDDYEKEVYQKSGYVRWQSIMHFYSIGLVKAGWLKKHKGSWYITDEGKKALDLDPEKFIEISGDKYKEWATSRDLLKNQEEEDESEEATISASYEQSQATAREEIKEYIRALNPYEFQDLIAALFRGMGYYTPFVAPKGPDGGIDIVAYRDPIGAESPRVRIQVKHRPDTKVSGAEIRALSGGLHKEGYIGIIVSSGGFTGDAINEIRSANKHIEKIDIEDFINLWEQHYDKLSDEDKALLPLRKISFLAPEE